jgi:hypothetical protein
MKKTLLPFLMGCFFFPFFAEGSSSPMVERHIFSPAPEVKGLHKSPLSLKLEKDLLFTGVILSSKGNWAIIRESEKAGDTATSGLRKEGDEIAGMVIMEIGKNYLILKEQGKEVRLNLYHEGKPRPPEATGPESPPSYSKATGDASVTIGQPQQGSAKDSAPKEQPNPFRDAVDKMDQGPEETGGEGQKASDNPFLDAVGETE